MRISEEQATASISGPKTSLRLGAHLDPGGVTFSTYSEHASAIDLCLFGTTDDGEQRAGIPFSRADDGFWRVRATGVGAGERYGFRVHGPYSPRDGYRFNPSKLILDPYAFAITGELDWNGPVFGYSSDHGHDTSLPDSRDNVAFVPKSVVVDRSFDWGGDERPAIPWQDTVIYEAHVKGLTKLHSEVPPELRGTYLGVSHPAVIDHLRSIGVTSIELLPVHISVDEGHLVQRGLTNYWGYNSIGFFAPTPRYAVSQVPGSEVNEFKQMVKSLHAIGIEIILDVVYNHSGEGNHTGPTLCFRGLDNSLYYRLVEGDKRFYEDFTGTGNTLDIRHPAVIRLVMDSLRYWVEEMHVDGFRFDLAPALARDGNHPETTASLFKSIFQDPVLSSTKLIAEPWDLGPSGYMLGRFPRGWSEWNGKFRDATRSFWRGDTSALNDLAYRLTGSSDLFSSHGRPPQASVNFVTAHDGFTLEDLVSYNHKHNLANGEENHDGANLNYSFNHGVEGVTPDTAILAARDRHKRNLLAMLFVAQGVPMICAGDELGRSQAGNNNAYCHDSELSWINWRVGDRETALVDFVQRLARLRANRPALRRRAFFVGQVVGPSTRRDLVWYKPSGAEMTHAAWHSRMQAAVAFRCSNEIGRPSAGSDDLEQTEWLFIMINQGKAIVRFAFPVAPNDGLGLWHLELSTTDWVSPAGVEVEPSGSFDLEAQSVTVWSWTSI
jgi:isoamylase